MPHISHSVNSECVNVRNIAKSEYYFLQVCPSVCPSVFVEYLGSYWMDFHEIWHLSIFRKSVEKIQFSLKSGINNRHFT